MQQIITLVLDFLMAHYQTTAIPLTRVSVTGRLQGFPILWRVTVHVTGDNDQGMFKYSLRSASSMDNFLLLQVLRDWNSIPKSKLSHYKQQRASWYERRWYNRMCHQAKCKDVSLTVYTWKWSTLGNSTHEIKEDSTNKDFRPRGSLAGYGFYEIE